MSRSLGAQLLVLIIAGCSIDPPTDTPTVPITKPMKSTLQSDCREYLEKGPPKHMDDYVPESLTEIVIEVMRFALSFLIANLRLLASCVIL